IAPREPQRAPGEDALRVGEMADHLADAPLAGLVAEARLRLVQRAEQRERFLELALEDGQDRAGRHAADVARVVVRVVSRGRACGLIPGVLLRVLRVSA